MFFFIEIFKDVIITRLFLSLSLFLHRHRQFDTSQYLFSTAFSSSRCSRFLYILKDQFLDLVLDCVFSFSSLFFPIEKVASLTTTPTTNTLTPISTNQLTLNVVESQTSVENGRKFTKYKVIVNFRGRQWEIWRRYKEFNSLNEKVIEFIDDFD